MAEEDTFPHRKQVILTITPVISGSLSAMGSALIVFILMKDRKRKLSKTYHRLLLGLSISDVQNSIRACFSGFLMPSGTPGVWGAVGNTQTCSALGFLAQLGSASTCYSIFLSIYFLIRIQPKRTDDNLRRIEPIMHGFSIMYALSTAIAGLLLEVYHPVQQGIGCWVAAYPTGCQEDELVECTRGGNSAGLIWYFGGILIVIGWFTIIGCMVAVYVAVRKQLRVVEMRYNSVAGQNDLASGNRLRQTRQQAALYISAYFLTYFWSTVGRLVENNVENPSFFYLSLLQQVFYPSQGFFNFFIYIRPMYAELKKNYPLDSPHKLLGRILGAASIDKTVAAGSRLRLYQGSSSKNPIDGSSRDDMLPPSQKLPVRDSSSELPHEPAQSTVTRDTYDGAESSEWTFESSDIKQTA